MIPEQTWRKGVGQSQIDGILAQKTICDRRVERSGKKQHKEAGKPAGGGVGEAKFGQIGVYLLAFFAFLR